VRASKRHISIAGGDTWYHIDLLSISENSWILRALSADCSTNDDALDLHTHFYISNIPGRHADAMRARKFLNVEKKLAGWCTLETRELDEKVT
jgi:hypothetical protein